MFFDYFQINKKQMTICNKNQISTTHTFIEKSFVHLNPKL